MTAPSGWGALAAAWAGAAGVASAAVVPAAGLRPLAAVALLAAVCVVLAVLRPRGAVAISAVAGLVALGLVRAPVAASGSAPTGALTLSGTVRDVSAGGAVVDVEDVVAADASAAAVSTVFVPLRGAHAAVGERVEVEATSLRAPSGRPGPTGAAAMARLGVTAVAAGAQVTVLAPPALPDRILAAIRAQARQRIDAALSQPAASLLLGVAFGLHESLDAGTRAALQNAGLIHIVAVSGLKEGFHM